jgi:ATP-dependent helicase/nuclease subunit A
LLGYGEDALRWAEIEPVLAEASRVLDASHMAEWLGERALAEVEISAELPELGNRRIHGFIDRLVIGDDEIRVLDYKSNAVVPDHPVQVPEGLVRQMAAYRGALRLIHPDKPVRCAILWTASGEVMPLSDAQLDASLRTPPVS